MPDEIVTDPTPDPEPEGVIEIDKPAGTKEKVVPLAALTAERQRIRKQADEQHAKELEPLRAAAAERDRLAADLQALEPQLRHLQKHPELLQRDQPPEVQAVSDEDAEAYAREMELYTGSGLNTQKAKQIIAKNRAEMKRVASEAASAAVRPIAETTHLQNSRNNFLWAAQQRQPNGQAMVDPQILANEWAKVPAELSAQPEVAQLILDRSIGAMYRAGKQPPAAVEREPVYSEASGGRIGSGYQISDMERSMARTTNTDEKEWTKNAQKYRPGQTNVLGE